MFSLSTAKRKAAKHAAAQQQQQQRSATVNASAGRSDEDLAGSRAGVDELGRVLSGGWRGRSKSDLRCVASRARQTLPFHPCSRSASGIVELIPGSPFSSVDPPASRSALPLSPPPSTSKLPPLPPPPPQWLFSPTVIPPAPPATDDVAWGLIPVRTNVVLGLADVGPVVHTLAESLGRRALDTPLLFSSLALDVSVPKIKSLIGTYLATMCVVASRSQVFASGATTDSRALPSPRSQRTPAGHVAEARRLCVGAGAHVRGRARARVGPALGARARAAGPAGRRAGPGGEGRARPARRKARSRRL